MSSGSVFLSRGFLGIVMGLLFVGYGFWMISAARRVGPNGSIEASGRGGRYMTTGARYEETGRIVAASGAVFTVFSGGVFLVSLLIGRLTRKGD